MLNWVFTDTHETYVTLINNSVLNTEAANNKSADATLKLNRSTLNDIILQKSTYSVALNRGEIKVIGNSEQVKLFFSLFDPFNLWFNIVTPRSLN